MMVKSQEHSSVQATESRTGEILTVYYEAQLGRKYVILRCDL